jgi:hypothetical protein
MHVHSYPQQNLFTFLGGVSELSCVANAVAGGKSAVSGLIRVRALNHIGFFQLCYMN